jgi:hypothetical protein
VNGELETYVSRYLDEILVPHLLTPDDLFVRHSGFYGQWQMRAIDICGVDADGTVHGELASCSERPPPAEPCYVVAFDEPPFRWIAGETTGEHLTLLGEIGQAWPRTASNVRVDGDHAFLSTFDDGLRVVSIANPAAPVEVGHFIAPDDWANDLKVLHAAGLRVVVTASTTSNVIDVSVPSAPALLAQIPFSAHSVFVEGTTAYLVDGYSAAVEVWSLAQPQAPVRLAAWTHPDEQTLFLSWHDIYVAGGIAYLSDISGTGLHVVDFRTPQAPVVLGGEQGAGPLWHSPWLTSIGGQPVAIDGTEFSTPGLRLLDGDPASATFLATLGEWSLGTGSAHNLMAIGPRIYLAHYRHGVRVLDASDPANVVQLGYFNSWLVGEGGAGDMGTFGIDLDPARRRIYAADSTRGLLILEGDSTVFP